MLALVAQWIMPIVADDEIVGSTPAERAFLVG